ncbi:uncharacterized protein LOC128955340 [Oppia nitens]|uniref:uncharacterized protein LOC128955340 n=1 Tax=Oppia nitens TaxID=1686743 RepID=UPI0023DAEACF|nr:uncharacterized protein LOC128955340 [Oppia nitens]
MSSKKHKKLKNETENRTKVKKKDKHRDKVKDKTSKDKKNKINLKTITTTDKTVDNVISDVESLPSDVIDDLVDISDNEDYKTDNWITDEINNNKLSDAPLHQLFPRLRYLAKDDIETAKRKGIEIKTGIFSKQEKSIMTANWNQFIKDFPVDNPYLFIGVFRYVKESQDMDSNERQRAQQIAKVGQLWLRLAKGLPNRPLCLIYRRALRMFSGLKKSKNLTDEDRQHILDMHSNGMKISDIAYRIFCEPKTVTEIIRNNVNTTTGDKLVKRWNDSENKRFIKTIKEVMKEDNINEYNYNDIPWGKVAHKMKNRSITQCRNHFKSRIIYLMLNPDFDGIKNWSLLETKRLIYGLYKENYENECDIDWDYFKEKFSHVSIFGEICRNWRTLKYTNREYQLMTHKQNVEYLYNKYIANNDIEELEQFWKDNVDD